MAIEPEERMDHIDTGPVADEDNLELQQEAPGEDVSDALLREDVNRADSWLQYNKGLEQTGFSPAYRLTPDNVGTLSRAWQITTDTAGLQTNPIVVPGDPPVLYFTQSNQVIQAVNARTGDQYWQFKYSPERASGIAGRNRGVAVHGDKIYFGTADSFVLALNRYTGEQAFKVDTLMDDDEKPQVPKRTSFTHAPVVFNGRVLMGHSGDTAGWSALTAVDAEAGEVAWQQRTAPKSEWIGDSWKFSSNAAWMSAAIDPESETVIVPIANPDPMHNGIVRPGPNKLSNSLVAYDLKSGDVKWVNQIMPHEVWDYDVSDVPTVFEMEVDGERRRVVSEDWKAAWTYVIDVETGELINRTDAFAKQEHRFGVGEFFNLPPRGKENAGFILPPRNGASEWPTNSFDRLRGLRYIGYSNAPNGVFYDPDWEWAPDNLDGQGGGETNIADQYEADAGVVAVDLASGDIAWRWQTDDLDQSWKTPNKYFPGGTSATAGGLVFQGTPGGHLVALDAEAGERVWQDDLGGRPTATPVVWHDSAADKQFVSIAANDTIITYASSG